MTSQAPIAGEMTSVALETSPSDASVASDVTSHSNDDVSRLVPDERDSSDTKRKERARRKSKLKKLEDNMEELNAVAASVGADEPTSEAPAEKSEKEESCLSETFRIFCYPMTLALLFIKLFYFNFIGALGCILPFLSIYFKQQGLTPQQIGLISGLRPVVGFTSGPVWGALADRYNVRRIMFLISITAWLGVFVAIAFVPSPTRLDSCPEDIVPHRSALHPHNALQDDDQNSYTLQLNNGTKNVSKAEYDVIRESIHWIYESHSVSKIFVTILCLILLGEFFQSPTTALSDAGTIQ